MSETTTGLDVSRKLKCKDCPRCQDNYPGKTNPQGVHFYICGMSGNIVYKDQWKEERRSGSGYILHGSGCGLYDSVEHALSQMTKSEVERWKKENGHT